MSLVRVGALAAALPLLLLAGCPDPKGSAGISDVTAEVSAYIGSVVIVRWTTSGDVATYVRYGGDDTLALSTPEVAGAGEHTAYLIGNPAEAEVRYQVVPADGSEGSDVGTITTNPLSVDLPSLTVEGGGNDQFIVNPLLGATTGPTIIDPEGRFTWYWKDTRGLDVYRARVSRDHEWMIYNAASVSGDPADDSVIVKVRLDGSEEQTVAVPLLAHDWVELPDGTLTVMAVEYRDEAGNPSDAENGIRGDKLVEIAPDGTQTDVWSAWDCFDPETDIGTDSEIGWTFANALDYDEGRDSYFLSLRNFSSIVRIDRATGTCPWVFGSTAATLEPSEGSEVFLHEHQFEVEEDSIVVFDNDGAPGNESRVLEYAWDEDANTAESVWEYRTDPSIYTFVLGEPHRLDDGDTMITWSVGGKIERVSPDGTATWSVSSELGYAFGFMEPTPNP